MTTLRRNEFPPQGWQFFQPQTGWKNPSAMIGFDASVVAIIKHRTANATMTTKNNLSTNFEVVANELLAFTRQRLGMPTQEAALPKPKAPAALPSLSGRAAAAVADVKKLAAGFGTLFEWEESGLAPEPMEVAEARAAICNGCPKNDQNKSLTEYFTVPVANAISGRMARLNGLNLKTSHDVNLKVCQACLCPLRLKVFCPSPIVLKRTKPETRAELDPRCWILQLK